MLLKSCAFFLGLMMVSMGSSSARAEAVDPQAAYQYAQTILSQALSNPYLQQLQYGPALARIAELLPAQRFRVIYQGTAEYVNQCFGPSKVDGSRVQHSGFTELGGCYTGFNGGRPILSCPIAMCPSSLSQDLGYAAHVIIHEMGHVVHGTDECYASGIAIIAFRLAGLNGQLDAYTTPCHLDGLIAGPF